MAKYLTRSNSREKLILASMLKRNAVCHGIEGMTSPTCHVTQCLHSQKAENRQDMELDKTPMPAPVTYFLQQGFHLKASQNSTTIWGPSVQTWPHRRHFTVTLHRLLQASTSWWLSQLWLQVYSIFWESRYSLNWVSATGQSQSTYIFPAQWHSKYFHSKKKEWKQNQTLLGQAPDPTAPSQSGVWGLW